MATIAYVAVSRTKTHCITYIEDRLQLMDAIEGWNGAKVCAINGILALA